MSEKQWDKLFIGLILVIFALVTIAISLTILNINIVEYIYYIKEV